MSISVEEPDVQRAAGDAAGRLAWSIEVHLVGRALSESLMRSLLVEPRLIPPEPGPDGPARTMEEEVPYVLLPDRARLADCAVSATDAQSREQRVHELVAECAVLVGHESGGGAVICDSAPQRRGSEAGFGLAGNEAGGKHPPRACVDHRAYEGGLHHADEAREVDGKPAGPVQLCRMS